MKTCPTCQKGYPDNFAICPDDGAQLQEPFSWTEGKIVRGKYQLIAKVGQGGMGSVYKALHIAFGEMRALKVIAPELLSDELFVKRFTHEAVITRRLQHPNAVRVDDIDKAEDGRPYIVMEFIDGKSLKKLIREEGPLPVPRVLSIIKQCASALDAAHKLGMVHRDIKPDNIALVDAPDGEMVKVLDFGIAKVKEARLGENAGLTLTGAGVVIGTPQYMSPEQAMGKRGDELDGRADLYSLGVVMYQMLTADLPFKADTTMEMLLAHMQKPPLPIEVSHPELDVPTDVAALTMRLLEKNRDLRPASGRVLMQEIEKLEKESIPGKTRVVTGDELLRANEDRGTTGPSGGAQRWPTVTPPPPPPPGPVRRPEPPKVVKPPVAPPRQEPVQPRAKESRWGIWVALIVLCVGLGGGGWYILRPTPKPAAPTLTLTADPASVEKGSSVTLHWSALNATDVDLEPGVGKVKPEGSTSVTPTESTTYTLTATGPTGGNNTSTFVSVLNPPPPVKPQVENPPQSDNPGLDIKREQQRTVKPVHKDEPHVYVPPPPPPVDTKAIKSAITLGDFHFNRGEYDDAIASYQKGLQADSSNSELRQRLGKAIEACKKENAILNEGLSCGSR
jgi:serine/threonine protein kinase